MASLQTLETDLQVCVSDTEVNAVNNFWLEALKLPCPATTCMWAWILASETPSQVTCTSSCRSSQLPEALSLLLGHPMQRCPTALTVSCKLGLDAGAALHGILAQLVIPEWLRL